MWIRQDNEEATRVQIFQQRSVPIAVFDRGSVDKEHRAWKKKKPQGLSRFTFLMGVYCLYLKLNLT